jgi:hypothetical protein
VLRRGGNGLHRVDLSKTPWSLEIPGLASLVLIQNAL